MSVLITLIMLSLIILAHEWGHFMAAKACGVTVLEFAMGLGPKLISKQKGETLYSVRLIPLGGFCKMAGEDGESENGDAPDAPDAQDGQTDARQNVFYSKPPSRRAIILAAGAAMNYLLAFIVFLFLYLSTGSPALEIKSLAAGFPAQKAGLLPGDRILAVDKTKVNIWDDFTFALGMLPNEAPFDITVLRGGKKITITLARAYSQDDGRYVIGLTSVFKSGFLNGASSDGAVRIGFFESAKFAFFQIFFTVRASLALLAQMAAQGLLADAFAGPIGLTTAVGTVYAETSKIGFLEVFLQMAQLLALISISVGFFNLLPLPALDGGRLLFVFSEVLFKKRLDPSKEALVHFVGFALLILLAAIIAGNDILRIIGKKGA